MIVGLGWKRKYFIKLLHFCFPLYYWNALHFSSEFSLWHKMTIINNGDNKLITQQLPAHVHVAPSPSWGHFIGVNYFDPFLLRKEKLEGLRHLEVRNPRPKQAKWLSQGQSLRSQIMVAPTFRHRISSIRKTNQTASLPLFSQLLSFLFFPQSFFLR